MNCSSGPGAASGAHSRNVAQWQSSELITHVTGSSPVVPIWSMCVSKRTGGMRHTAKLTPSRYGANCDDGDCKKPVRNPRQPGETGALWSTYGRSAEGKPKNLFSRQMQMKVRFLLLRFCGSYPQNRHLNERRKQCRYHMHRCVMIRGRVLGKRNIATRNAAGS